MCPLRTSPNIMFSCSTRWQQLSCSSTFITRCQNWSNMNHMKPLKPLILDENAAERWQKRRQRWDHYSKAKGAVEKTKKHSVQFSYTWLVKMPLKYTTPSYWPIKKKEKNQRTHRKNLRSTALPRKLSHARGTNSTRVRKTADHSMSSLSTYEVDQKRASLESFKTA